MLLHQTQICIIPLLLAHKFFCSPSHTLASTTLAEIVLHPVVVPTSAVTVLPLSLGSWSGIKYGLMLTFSYKVESSLFIPFISCFVRQIHHLEKLLCYEITI